MKKKLVAIIGSGALVAGIFVAGASFAESKTAEIRGGSIKIGNQSEAQFPSMAKITMDQAVQNALTAVPGQVLKAELEEEDDYLVYGVEVVGANKTIWEIKVDAGSGDILAKEQDQVDKHESEDRDHED